MAVHGPGHHPGISSNSRNDDIPVNIQPIDSFSTLPCLYLNKTQLLWAVPVWFHAVVIVELGGQQEEDDCLHIGWLSGVQQDVATPAHMHWELFWTEVREMLTRWLNEMHARDRRRKSFPLSAMKFVIRGREMKSGEEISTPASAHGPTASNTHAYKNPSCFLIAAFPQEPKQRLDFIPSLEMKRIFLKQSEDF